MAEVSTTRQVDCDAETLWAVVSDPTRLAEWVPTANESTSRAPGSIHIKGESHGHPYDLESQVRADVSAKRLEWRSDTSSYRGWLQIRAESDGSNIEVKVAIPDAHVPAKEDALDEIRQGIDDTIDRLIRLTGDRRNSGFASKRKE